MTDKVAIPALIERLEKAEGPDATVDMALWWHLSLHEDTRRSFGSFVNEQVAKHGTDILAQFYDSSKPHCLANLSTRERYTASLDAALALVGRVLPGWGWQLCSDDDLDENERPKANLYSPDYDGSRDFCANGASAPLALLIAALKAIAQTDGTQEENVDVG